jgi:hypothetical protein
MVLSIPSVLANEELLFLANNKVGVNVVIDINIISELFCFLFVCFHLQLGLLLCKKSGAMMMMRKTTRKPEQQ